MPYITTDTPILSHDLMVTLLFFMFYFSSLLSFHPARLFLRSSKWVLLFVFFFFWIGIVDYWAVHSATVHKSELDIYIWAALRPCLLLSSLLRLWYVTLAFFDFFGLTVVCIDSWTRSDIRPIEGKQVMDKQDGLLSIISPVYFFSFYLSMYRGGKCLGWVSRFYGVSCRSGLFLSTSISIYRCQSTDPYSYALRMFHIFLLRVFLFFVFECFSALTGQSLSSRT